MTIIRGLLCRGSFRDTWDHASDRCFHFFPCLSDPAAVMLHLIFVGVLFLFDTDFREKTRLDPWFMGMYLLLFVATLAQYFFTSGSSPGYVLDAMRTVNETDAILRTSVTSNVVITVDRNQSGRNFLGDNATSWTKLVMDMYPPGSSARTWTCSYCNVLQPPRAKHCHDCDKCVLQFDHHCVWLGTCIGQGNHCRFWWYICEETALCFWTGILYITYLKANILKVDVIMITLIATLSISLIFLILLLFIGIPERVYPFSKGVCRNVYNFCCGRSSMYRMEPLPTAQELEDKSKPYTCLNVLSFVVADILGFINF